MKTLILLSLTLLSTQSWAGHFDNKEIMSCRVTRMVDYTYFEESLSPNEYPDVEVAISPKGEFSFKVGGYGPYEKSEGDYVEFYHKPHMGSAAVVNTQHKDVITMEVEYRRTLARATLKVKESGSAKAKTIAYLICDKGILDTYY